MAKPCNMYLPDTNITAVVQYYRVIIQSFVISIVMADFSAIKSKHIFISCLTKYLEICICSGGQNPKFAYTCNSSSGRILMHKIKLKSVVFQKKTI